MKYFIFCLGLIIWSISLSALNVWVFHLSPVSHILLCCLYGIVYSVIFWFVDYKYF